MNIIDTIKDPNVFAPWFTRGDWSRWFVFLKALFALPLADDEVEIVHHHTGRRVLLDTPFKIAWLVVGRRGGKSFVLALIAAYLAAFKDYRPHLQPGEVATIPIIAADKRQARTIRRYVEGMFTHIPMLAKLVKSMTQEGLELHTSVCIEIHVASFRSVRGYTLAAALCDEAAFWRNEDSANPDKEILNALKPGLGTIPGAMMLVASSPYAKRGILWNAFKKHFAADNARELVWKATTLEMNPTFDASIVEEALADDESAAKAEYLAEFRSDIESFVARETVEARVEWGCIERGFDHRNAYFAFIDPSGGTSDSMTLAIAHKEDDDVVIDVTREARAPFSPEDVVVEFAEVLRGYRIKKVQGDAYAGTWPREQFRKRGIDYELAPEPKSRLYQALLPMLNSGSICLLDDNRTVTQISNLERRTARGGRDSIDHMPGGHDDLANVIAGVASMIGGKQTAHVSTRKLKGF